MKKQFTIILLSFFIVLVVIGSKIISERNVQNIGLSFSEIYHDRLLVESYVYQLNELFYRKKIALISSDNRQFTDEEENEIVAQTLEMFAIVDKYSSTKLTQNERVVFDKLIENVKLISAYESEFILGQTAKANEIITYCDDSVAQLHLLSEIQLAEGKSLNESSKRQVSFSQIVAQLDWAVTLIFLLLLIFLMKQRKVFEKIFPRHQLN